MNLNITLPIYEIEYLKNKTIHDIKIKHRVNNTPTISDFIVNTPYKIEDNLIYGGLFLFPKGNIFYLSILLDRNIDKENYLSFLKSKKGIKIQKAVFRDTYLKPLKKWLKNRDIADKQFAISLMKEKILGNFDDLSKYLDSIKSYTVLDISRYTYLH